MFSKMSWLALMFLAVVASTATIILSDVALPENVVVTSGGSASLRCESLDGGDIMWSVCETKEDCVRITVGTVIVHPEPERYGIREENGGVFVLTINPVTELDGISYMCESTKANGGFYSELIVVGSEMNCAPNTTEYAFFENDPVVLTCHVAFDGRWAPSMRCRVSSSEWLPGTDESTNEMAVWRVTLQPTHEMHHEEIHCEVFFEYPKSWENLGDGEASNVPEMYELGWTSEPVTVLFGPRNLTVVPKTIAMQLGDVVTCLATANPSPSYLWTDTVSGKVLSASPDLSFTDRGDVGLRSLKCEAQNMVDGKFLEENVVMEFLVCDEEICEKSADHASTIVIGTIMGTLFLISFIGNIFMAWALKKVQDSEKEARLHKLGPSENCEKPQRSPAHEANSNQSIPDSIHKPKHQDNVSNVTVSKSADSTVVPTKMSSDFYHSIDDEDVEAAGFVYGSSHSCCSSASSSSLSLSSSAVGEKPSDLIIKSVNPRPQFQFGNNMRQIRSDNNFRLHYCKPGERTRRDSCPAITSTKSKMAATNAAAATFYDDSDNNGDVTGALPKIRQSNMAVSNVKVPRDDTKTQYMNYFELEDRNNNASNI